jgi:hypothetical protein
MRAASACRISVVCCAAIVGSLFAGTALAAPPAKSPGASQYVEQIPTAAGSKATSPVSSNAQTAHASTTPASSTPTSKRVPRKQHQARPTKTKLITKQHQPSPVHAAIATSNGTSGFGRGVLVGFVLVAAMLIALAGLVLRRRSAR